MCNRYTESREYRAELQKALVDFEKAHIEWDPLVKALCEEIMHFDRWSYAHQARCQPCNVAALRLHGVAAMIDGELHIV